MTDETELSDEAKTLMAAWFGIGQTTVTLMLRESIPTPTTRAALDELVAAKAISKEPFNKYGGEVYKRLIDGASFFKWFGENMDNPRIKFQLMQPKASIAPSHTESVR